MTPHRRTVLGAVMILVGVLVVSTNETALAAFPTQWGGPNLLAGLINLLAGGLAIAGAVVIVIVWMDRR